MIGREFECHHVIVILVILGVDVGVRFPSRRRRVEREEFGWHFPFFSLFWGRESAEKEEDGRVDVKAVLFRMLW